MEKNEKHEIRVSAPSRPSLRPEEAIIKTQQKALEEERFRVLELSRRIGKKFAPMPIIVGASLLIISVYLIVTNAVLTFLMVGSPEIKTFFIVLSIFWGVVNVVTGLLLMSY